MAEEQPQRGGFKFDVTSPYGWNKEEEPKLPELPSVEEIARRAAELPPDLPSDPEVDREAEEPKSFARRLFEAIEHIVELWGVYQSASPSPVWQPQINVVQTRGSSSGHIASRSVVDVKAAIMEFRTVLQTVREQLAGGGNADQSISRVSAAWANLAAQIGNDVDLLGRWQDLNDQSPEVHAANAVEERERNRREMALRVIELLGDVTDQLMK